MTSSTKMSLFEFLCLSIPIQREHFRVNEWLMGEIANKGLYAPSIGFGRAVINFGEKILGLPINNYPLIYDQLSSDGEYNHCYSCGHISEVQRDEGGEITNKLDVGYLNKRLDILAILFGISSFSSCSSCD